MQETQDTQEKVLTSEDQALLEFIATMQGNKTEDKTFQEFMKSTTETLKALAKKVKKSRGNCNSRQNKRNCDGNKCKHCSHLHPSIKKMTAGNFTLTRTSAQLGLSPGDQAKK